MSSNPGSFIWYDLLTSDPKAAIDFYEHVIGWKSQPMDNDSGYVLFLGPEGPVGGTIAMPADMKKTGVSPHWTSNVQVRDADATASEVKRLGGKVVSEPSEFPNVGRLGAIADPTGAPIHIFAPSVPMRVRDATKPGEFAWHELASTDHEAAFAFYGKLFGWKKSSEFDMGPMGKYLLYGNGGPDLGGMFTRLDAALDRAKAKGARVLNGPMPVPGGARIVQLADPQGALFALHEAPPK
jgi:uncharacterized protein